MKRFIPGLAALLFVAAQAAYAHTELVSSTPENKDVLEAAPKEVVLNFSEVGVTYVCLPTGSFGGMSPFRPNPPPWADCGTPTPSFHRLMALFPAIDTAPPVVMSIAPQAPMKGSEASASGVFDAARFGAGSSRHGESHGIVQPRVEEAALALDGHQAPLGAVI